MNKFLGAVLIMPLLLFSSGCGFDDAFVADPERKSYEGVLSEQLTNDKYAGTHIVAGVDDDVVIPVRSHSINLSSGKYLGNFVEVMGSMNYEDNVFEADGISVLRKLVEENAIREFVEYKNTDFGIQLKYYTDWDLDLKDSSVRFFAPYVEGAESDHIVISQESFRFYPVIPEDSDENVEIDSPLQVYFDEKMSDLGSISPYTRKIGVDSLDSVMLDDGYGNFDYYLYRNGLIYKISFIASADNHYSENENVFNEMLSEFKFTGFTIQDNEFSDGNMDDGSENDDNDPLEEDSVENSAFEMPDFDNIELAHFESSSFDFSSGYPKNWYYAGSPALDDMSTYHYGMGSDSEPLENELVSLDIYKGELPDGMPLPISSHRASVTQYPDRVIIFVESGDRVYRVTGISGYEAEAFAVAFSIETGS